MKKALLLLQLIAVILAWQPGAAAGQRTMIFVDEPYPPYLYGEIGEVCSKGISHDILAHIFERLGMDFEIRLMPWARAMKTVKHGRADGLPLLMKNEEREAFLLFTEPILRNRELFYYAPRHLNDLQWQDFSDLQDYTIGLVNGYTYGEAFLKALAAYEFHVDYSPDSETNMRKLIALRVDLILEDESLVRGLLEKHPQWAQHVRPSSRVVSSYCWHMGIARESPLVRHVQEINAVIEDMKADGAVSAIRNSY